jgi:uncharacterized protein (TIGR01319 family)
VDSLQQPDQPALNGAGLSADSLVAVDFGSTSTRAVLLDVASGVFRFVAAGSAPTTIDPPFANVSEGLRNALDDLTTIGRAFVDETEMLISPTRSDGSGVDRLVATTSAGPPLKTVILGLLPDTSVESARRAAAAAYVRVVDVIGLGDRRRQEEQVDSILSARPDLVIIAGGTDGGSSEAVLRQAETVRIACQLMEPGRQPHVLYAGNAALRDAITRTLRGQAEVTAAGNVRPGLEAEDIISARHELGAAYEAQRVAAFAGYAEVAQWASSGSGVKPTAMALGRLAQFISKSGPSGAARPALIADVGSANVVLAAAMNGKLWLNAQTGLGVGHSAQAVLERAGVDALARWLPVETSAAEVREYAWHKAAYPATLPQEVKELHLEHALAREALRLAAAEVRPGWPVSWRTFGAEGGLMPRFDPILATGAVLAGAPRPAHAALILLDALEPVGVFTLLLDVNGIASALGAAAGVQPLALAQIWGSSAVLRLGTVIAPVGGRGPASGQVAVRVKMTGAGGESTEVEVAHGAVQALNVPLAAGQTGTVTVQPGRGFDVGRGPGRGVVLRDLPASALGVIVDARGRPLTLARDAQARRAAMQKWLWGMGN